MTDNWWQRRPIVVGDDDPELLGRSAGLIQSGEVKVVAASSLSVGQRNQGRELVNVALAEARELQQRLQVDQQLVSEQLADVAAKLKQQTGRVPTAQEIVDERDARRRRTARTAAPKPKPPAPAPRRLTVAERRLPDDDETPPKSVSRHDLHAVGRWSRAIAQGKTKVR